MGATYLMSYPAKRWTIRGGENFRSKQKQATNPRAAMHEWLTLCDAITKHGGRILVMPPADVDPPLTGMMYTANAGALFKQGDSWTWMLSKMSVAHRQAEQAHIKAFWAEAGVTTTAAEHTWEGQADVATLPGNRFLLTWGVRSVKESLDEVHKRLPTGARTLDIKLREPWFHGDTCMDAMTTRGGDTVLLAFGGALVDRTHPRAAQLPRRQGRGAADRRGRLPRLRRQRAVRQRHRAHADRAVDGAARPPVASAASTSRSSSSASCSARAAAGRAAW